MDTPRICQHCGKEVAVSRVTNCNHCGLPFDGSLPAPPPTPDPMRRWRIAALLMAGLAALSSAATTSIYGAVDPLNMALGAFLWFSLIYGFGRLLTRNKREKSR